MWGEILSTVLPTVLGAAFGNSGGSGSTTQTISYQRPQLTDLEQAIQNYFGQQALTQTGQNYALPMLGQLQDYYYGNTAWGKPSLVNNALPTTPQAQAPVVPQLTPEQQALQGLPKTAGLNVITGDFTIPGMDTRKAQKYKKYYNFDYTHGKATLKPEFQLLQQSLPTASSQVSALPAATASTGLPTQTGGMMVGGATTTTGAATGAGNFQAMLDRFSYLRNLYSSGKTTSETRKEYSNLKSELKAVLRDYYNLSSTEVEDVINQAKTGMTTADLENYITQTYYPEFKEPTQPLENIMSYSPEQITAQFDILREKGKEGINQWYEAATQDLSRRGIAIGAPSTRTNKDWTDLLTEKGRREQSLLQDLALAEEQTQQQLPYQQLQTLEGIRQYEQGYGLSAQAPWINVGTGIYNAPWGIAGQTQTTTLPQNSVYQNAMTGLNTGLGIYDMGKQMGWWGTTNAATSLPTVNAMSTAGNAIGGWTFPTDPYNSIGGVLW